jgi:hypothetical protein
MDTDKSKKVKLKTQYDELPSSAGYIWENKEEI